MMNISELIKEAHDNAVERGFYEDPGTIDDKLMLIVSELGEALEADRKDRHTIPDISFFYKPGDWTSFELWKLNFEQSVKDTFEDEIADTFIRLMDFCGWQKIEIDQERFDISQRVIIPKEKEKDISTLLLSVVKSTVEIQKCPIYDKDSISWAVLNCFGWLSHICAKLKIDIEKHITAKMAYNRTRPYKHGKAY